MILESRMVLLSKSFFRIMKLTVSITTHHNIVEIPRVGLNCQNGACDLSRSQLIHVLHKQREFDLYYEVSIFGESLVSLTQKVTKN
jgi:hypothetical protein